MPVDLSPRVLRGIDSLGSFLIHQSRRLSKSPKNPDEFSPEQRRVARENVPWDVVSEPAKLARDLLVLARRALGETSGLPRADEDGEEILPPDPTKLISTSPSSGTRPTMAVSRKRKASTPPTLSGAPKPKFKNFNGQLASARSASLATTTDGDGGPVASSSSVVIKKVAPRLKTQVRTETVEGRLAEIRTTTSETETVRWITTVLAKEEGSEGDASEGEGVGKGDEVEVRETRRVVTVIERVVWRKEKGEHTVGHEAREEPGEGEAGGLADVDVTSREGSQSTLSTGAPAIPAVPRGEQHEK
jgi:hypothetical protein